MKKVTSAATVRSPPTCSSDVLSVSIAIKTGLLMLSEEAMESVPVGLMMPSA